MTEDISRRAGATVAQLKHDIDSGLTGDKAPGFDPAAAPLGVDDEAAGTPPSPQVVAQAREAERRMHSKHPNEVDPRGAPDARFPRGPFLISMLMGAAAALVLMSVIALALQA